jgi:tetratricopeptide (TPR) repeat protein
MSSFEMPVRVRLRSSLLSPARSCPDPSPIFAEVWNPERREAVARQLAARPGGEAEFALLSRAVDAHREVWLEAHARACAATRVERSRTEAQLERALACLERDRARLDALLELLASPPREGLDLRRLLLELGDPARCEDGGTSAGQIAAPPQIAKRVAELRVQLDEIALLRSAQPRRASVESRQLVTAACELGFAPLLAEALALDGQIAVQLVELERAQASSREAARLAKSVGDLRLEFRCLRELVGLATEQLEDPARAADLLALMLGSFEQLGRPSDLLAETLVAESELARLRGDLEVAEAQLQRALEQRRAELDDEDVRVQQLELDLANVVAEQGRLDESLALYAGVLDRLRQLFGPRHPELATVGLNQAITLLEQGEPARARAHVAAALEVGREVYGRDSVKLAPLLVVLAQARAGEGDVEGALAAAREAQPLERRLPLDDRERGYALELEAALLVTLERYDEALEVHEQIEAELGPTLDDYDRIALEQSIGWLLCRVEGCRGARPRVEAVLAAGEERTVLFAQLGLAELELNEREPERARARLESVVPRLERIPAFAGKQEALAEAQFLLLRCALARGADARELGELVARVRAHAPLPTYIDSVLDEVERQIEP